jgi:G protein-coupled receptor Mth (Methuselah protein)
VYYPPHLYANYNYTFNGTDEIPAEEHIRGCICLLKTCVYRCCSPGEYMHQMLYCQKDTEVDQDHDFKVNGSSWKEEILKNPQFHFIVNNLPECKGYKVYFMRLQPESLEKEKWIYFKNNGSILYKNNSKTLRYNEFCLANYIEEGVHFGTSAMVCEKIEKNTKVSAKDIYKIGKLYKKLRQDLSTIPFTHS